ncbi:MAG TPA: DUF3053 family protein [Pseudoxanthomonas sp.]|nr:DUF3053 family protein [Pseudoxanthomonas sp.]
MNPLVRRTLPLFFACLALLGLAACSNEASERKAFIEFLQTRVIDQPGLRVPKLSEADSKSLGQYADHYAVIGDFNASMDKVFSEAQPTLQTLTSLSSPQALMEGGAKIADGRAALAGIKTELASNVGKAKAGKAALQQTDDLKPVYQTAYVKTVEAPAALMVRMLDETDSALAQAQEFSAFLKTNQKDIQFSGSQVQVESPALLEKLNAQLQAMNEEGQKINAVQRELSALINGS